MAKKLTSKKAKEILHDKSVHGHPLTDKQRRFFGYIAGGGKAQTGKLLSPAEYEKKYPPIYVTDPNDPRIGTYTEAGNEYRYKKPTKSSQQLPTIYTDNSNDPRLRAYQDSLVLHNQTKGMIDDLKVFEKYYGDTKTGGNKDMLADQWLGYTDDWYKNKGTKTSLAYNRLTKKNKKAPEPARVYKSRLDSNQVAVEYKKPVQRVEYKKPEPKKETPVEQKVTPQPIPVQQTQYSGTPVYAPTPYSPGAGALVGFRSAQGDTTYIQPQDYQRFAVPKYGQEYIKSQQKKEDGGYLGTTNKGFNYNPAWGGRWEDGGILPIAQVGKKMMMINDPRMVDVITNKKLTDKNKLAYNVDPEVIKGIVTQARKSGIDPYTALAISYQETGLGSTGNPLKTGRATFHLNPDVYGTSATNDPSMGVKAIVDRLNYAKDLQKKKIIPIDEAYALQSFGGYGIIKKGHPDLGGSDSMYGVPIPKEGLNMKKNPMYGKRVMDIRENILKKNPELVNLIEKKAMGGSLPGMTGFMYARQGAPSNGPYAKKTKASAKNGMSFYQNGLDWTPRNISQKGKKLKATDDGAFEPMPTYSGMAEAAGEVLSAPQKGLTKLVTGKYQYPSEAMGIKNPVGAFVTDVVLDPLSWIGVGGAAKNAAKTIGKGIAKTSSKEVAKAAGKTAENLTKKIERAEYIKELQKHGLDFHPGQIDKSLRNQASYRAGTIGAQEAGSQVVDPFIQHGDWKRVGYVARKYMKNLGLNPELESDVEKWRKGYIERSKKAFEFYQEPFNKEDILLEQLLNPFAIKNKKGGKVIKDDMGQWAHPGEITEIDSNEITMDGVPYPVLGISDTGDTQMMYPGEDYSFDGESVTEYPMAQNGMGIQDMGQLKRLDQLTNFTNYNTMAKKAKKAQVGSYIGGERMGYTPLDTYDVMNRLASSMLGKGYADLKQDISDSSFLKTIQRSLGESSAAIQPTVNTTSTTTTTAAQSMIIPGEKRGGKIKKAQLGEITGIAEGVKGVIGGVTSVVDAVKAKQEAKRAKALSELSAQASGTRPEIAQRKYVRPEDQLVNPGQTFPTYGTGTDFLQLQDGGEVTGMIGGIPTEIMNMYNPGDIYSDMGYEPLDDSEKVKNYRNGGIPKAQVGMIAQGVGAGTQLLGSLISGAINIGTNKMLKQTEQNMGRAAFQQGMASQQSPFMEDGGYLSHDWQPQVITQFGDYKLSDLLRPDNQSDIRRAGGPIRDIRSNYMGYDERMQSMAMGGQLKTHWGGGAELMSYNPYSPGSGETWMLKGNSHEESDGKGRTGIGLTYGKNMVEAERGEPVSEVKDGGQMGESAVVYGNLPISEFSAAELGDKKAKGKKFKRYIADLTKKENRSNKLMDKGMDMLQNIKGNNPFNMLEMSTAQAMITGADMTLKDIAMKKHTAAELQDVFNETAEEQGLDATALAAGRIKKAKPSDTARFGKSLKKAQTGNIVDEWDLKSGQYYQPIIDQTVVNQPYNIMSDAEAEADQWAASQLAKTKLYADKLERDQKAKEDKLAKRDKNWEKFSEFYNAALPFVRPSNRKPLSAEQLIPEMAALSMNQLEPVAAQTYQPMLTQVSKLAVAQPKINEINAQFNALQKTIGNNPAALSYLASQKYKAISQAVGEEFAMNQQREDALRAGNIGTLNDAALKNLAILDQQFQRQSAAKSATKAQAIGALSSIASKIAQNKTENLTAGIYENLYNYRFGPRGVAYNLNPLAKFDIPENVGLTDEEIKNAVLEAAKKKKGTKEKEKNGGIVKAIKNL